MLQQSGLSVQPYSAIPNILKLDNLWDDVIDVLSCQINISVGW